MLLLKGLKHGSEEAFQALFNKYASRLYFIAMRYLNDKEESEEIVQEVFYKVWVNHKTIEPELPFIPFLVRIAKNMIFNQSKHKIVQNAYFNHLSSSFVDRNKQTEEHILFNEVKKIIDQYIESFPPKRKETFILSRQQGLSNNEIAEKLNVSVRTVENHINQALKALKIYLKAYGYMNIVLILSIFFYLEN